MSRRIVGAVAAISMLGAVGACGDDDDEAGAEPTEVPSAATDAAPDDTSPPSDSTVSSDSVPSPSDGPSSTRPPGTTEPTADDIDLDDIDLDDVDRDATFTFLYSAGHTSFDPHTTPSAADQIYQRPVYDGLLAVGRDDAGDPALVPRLATGYEVADDGLSVEFELRDGVSFQDGTPFDAEAVRANLERALGEGSTVATLLASVESVEVVDPQTVVVRLSKRDTALPWTLATGTVGYMASPAAFDGDLAAEPVGTGPFRLTSAQRDGDIVYERWDDHWAPDAALVRELTITSVIDLNARYNSIQSGEADAAYMPAPLDAESRSLEAEGYHWDLAVSPVVNGVLLNTSLAPFDDVRVRRAVSMSLNRVEISETLLGGIGPPVYQPFSEGFVGHDPALDDDPFDLEAARALVAEAGAEGTSVDLIQPTAAPYDSLALLVQQAMSDIGLRPELVPISTTEARTTWRQGGTHAMVLGIIGYADPGQTLGASYLGPDNPGGAPAELVELADAAAALAPGGNEREAAYQDISAFLVENPIHVPLVNFTTVIVSRPEVVGSERLMVTGIAEADVRGVGKRSS